MTFSTLQQSLTSTVSTVLAAYRAGGRVSTALATYRAGGRIKTMLGCYRGAGRFAAMTGYRGSEHGVVCGFIATRTNSYPVCVG